MKIWICDEDPPPVRYSIEILTLRDVLNEYGSELRDNSQMMLELLFQMIGIVSDVEILRNTIVVWGLTQG